MPSVVITDPSPFPTHEAMTHVAAYQEQDMEDQGPIPVMLYDGLVIYNERSKIIYGKDSRQIFLNGMLIMRGGVQALDGKTAFQDFVQISKEKRQIYAVRKPKLLGAIHSTKVDLL